MSNKYIKCGIATAIKKARPNIFILFNLLASESAGTNHKTFYTSFLSQLLGTLYGKAQKYKRSVLFSAKITIVSSKKYVGTVPISSNKNFDSAKKLC